VSEYEYEYRRPGPLDVLPVLVRGAAGLWLRSATWGVQTSARAGGRLVRAAASQESAAELWRDAGAQLRGCARELLGVSELDHRIAQLMPPVDAPHGDEVDDVDDADDADPSSPSASPPTLREAGSELLRRSAEVDTEDGTPDDEFHPAFGRILGELHPDEARILRLLLLSGAQASVDVRTSALMGLSSQVVAPGLTMIGARAGCRHVARVPAYLNNVQRLGLIWFSQESLEDPMSYQVLEAQPEVMTAIKHAGRAKTVRRSIHLTPFGKDFCEACLPLESAGTELVLSTRRDQL